MSGINHILTKEQEEIVGYQGDELLVRGIAGSGKTLVMLRKAKLTAEKYPDQKTAVFTYGRTLTNASNLLMQQLKIENMDISTFHSWAMKTYRKMMRKRCLHMVQRRHDFLGDALNKLKDIDHRFIKEEAKYKDFLKDEISWIKGRGVDYWEAYKDANRIGRGSEVRVTQKDREVIFKIYQTYNKEKDYILDYDDFGLELSKRLDEIPDEFKFDHVFVDEAQDLQQVQLIVLRSIARKSFFVAADKGQKIYKTSFAWKDIGLNIRGGRTKMLRDSFRSTKQIIQLAASLQENDSIIKDEEYVPAGLPEKTGPKPVVFECYSRENQDQEIAKAVKQIREESPDSTIAVLGRETRKLYRIQYALQELNLSYEFVNNKKGNPYSPGVKLCTLHSSKGLEFDYVIILDLNEPDMQEDMDTEEYWEVERRLLYVGITRATTYVQLYYYDNPLRLLNELNEEYYEKVTV